MNTRFDVIIAGGGPAGTSAAIHLANSGLSILLAEQKKFPRPKLCGEFISPECLDHFDRLGVDTKLIASTGSELTETIFYSQSGRAVRVPSDWFGNRRTAVGLSRAEMDDKLLQRAKVCGVTVLEEAQVTRPIVNEETVKGVVIKTGDAERDYYAPVTVDATGRTRALARRVERFRAHKASLVAFKAHLADTRNETCACEIYFYKGGYGGLNAIEGGMSNLCFIVSAVDARLCESNPELVLRRVVSQNSRAAFTLKNARAETPWLAVTLEHFGAHSLTPARGLMAVGDAAAFIDPFTGSGMLMALQSGELVASSIVRVFRKPHTLASYSGLANSYRAEYRRRFLWRLRSCAVLRLAAFAPRLTEAAVFLSSNDRFRRLLTRATRAGGSPRTAVPALNS